MTQPTADTVFFDLGDTLGNAVTTADGRLTAFHPFSFVPALLQDLAQRGVRLGVISNTGENSGADVDQVLSAAGLLALLDPGLRIYSADIGLTKATPEIFRLAAERAGDGGAPTRVIYVGEDGPERDTAAQAGLRVCPHPLLVPEVLAGEAIRFVRLALPSDRPPIDWYRQLSALALVPMHIFGQEGRYLYGLASERTRARLSAMGVLADAYGAPNLSDTADFFLLRDDAARIPGFDGEARKLFDRGDGGLVLASRQNEHVIALPPERSLDEFHFDGARHGHTLKLIPDPLLFDLLIGPAAVGFALRQQFAGFDAPVTLSPQEKAAFDRITPESLAAPIERYSGYRPVSAEGTTIASRHVAHAGNSVFVSRLAADLEAAGGGRLTVRLHPFTHRGRTYHNVEAELRGASDEIVLVTAHLDSTAASSPNFDPAKDAAPGADDDASGVAAAVAIAARLTELAAEIPLAQTLRFVLFNAEEEGLVGSRAYAKYQRSLDAKIVAVFQMDMIGYNRQPPATWEVHAGYEESVDVERRSLELARLVQAVTPQVSPALEAPVLFVTASTPDGDPAAGRSDHASFHAYGYAACVSSERFFGGPEADANPNYHKREDRVDSAGFDLQFAAGIARALGAAAWVLARQAAQPFAGVAADAGFAAIESNPREVDTRKIGGRPEAPKRAPVVFEPLSSKIFLVTAVGSPSFRRMGFGLGESLTDKALAFVSTATPEAAIANATFAAAPIGLPTVAHFDPDSQVQRTAAGGAAVHLHQNYRGIPVFQMGHTVRFDPDGEPIDAPGNTVALPPGLDLVPLVGAAAAVRRAAEHIAGTGQGMVEADEFGEVHALPSIDAAGFIPEVASAFPLPSQPTVFEQGPFENAIPAHLVLFVQPEGTRLGWQIVLTLPGYADQYTLIVAADTEPPDVLYAKSTLHRAKGRGRVYEFSPGVTGRQLVEFPRPIAEYPAMPSTPLAGFPGDWIEVDSAVGNNTRATLGDTPQTLVGQSQGGAIVFDPADGFGDDQKVLNIFYFCNYMHDFLFVLGFDEAAGNFQDQNFTSTGRSGDFVRARAHSGAVYGTANMATGPDGLPPVMNMGLVTSTNRHTAFDADVVFHEFAHGLTQRLVGGPLDASSLDALQSGGMGEGWSDFFALTVQNFFTATEKTVSGDWVVNRAGGIRRAPYDDNYPYTYATLKNAPAFHAIGEVWCATLMMMVRRMVAPLGKAPAYRLAWQVVVDGLKLLPSNPTFLQARDAILMALDQLLAAGRITAPAHTETRRAAWTAFARFGMGLNAVSNDPDDLAGIVADFSVPPGL